MSEMEFHPLANLFPMLEAPQAGAFADDIKANGLRQVIVTFGGKILDGRNRYLACREAGVNPRFKEFTGDDPLSYVISLNLTRRHLTESQRATVAAKIATLPDGQRQVGKFAGVPSQAQAAAMMNISERSVRSARQVLENGTPEMIASVEQGRLKVSTAVRQIAGDAINVVMAHRPRGLDEPISVERLPSPGSLSSMASRATTPVRPANTELREDLKGAIASLRAVGKRLAGYKIRDIDNALATAEMVIDRHLPQAI
jgi:hypothetical protein